MGPILPHPRHRSWEVPVPECCTRSYGWKGSAPPVLGNSPGRLSIYSMILCLIECGYRVIFLMFPMDPKRFIGRCRNVQLELFRELLEPALAVLHNKRISTSSCCDLDLPSGWTSLRFPPRHCDLCRDDLIGIHRDRWGQLSYIELGVPGRHDVLQCSLTLIR